MEKISTEKAPKAIGPYSQAVKCNSLVFTAGQIALNPETNEMAGDTIEEQARQVMENIKVILEASKSSIGRALKVNVYMKDLNDFQKMNAIYAEYFPHKPARATIQAAKLPKDALIEIDVIAECD